ncbi:MAG: flagellin [Phycisphaeraceae bacterium]
MPSISSNLNRATSLMQGDLMLSQLRKTQTQMVDAERQIATGEKYSRPSDGANKTSAILYLRQQLAAREQYSRNLDHASSMLNNMDSALSVAGEVMRDVTSGAIGQIGVGADASTRKAQALELDSQLKAMIDLANQTYQGIPLFGGAGGSDPGKPMFEQFLGGVRYNGSLSNLEAESGSARGQMFTSNGADAFGALSSRIKSAIDLQPQAAADTPISSVAGATAEGVRLGPVQLTVNGSEVAVDLTSADTLGDVVTRVNDAIDQLDPGAGSLALAGEGFELTAGAGNTITLADNSGAHTAGDLGLALSATGGTDTGPSVNPRLTASTALADLGAAVDWTGGLQITHGEQTTVADFSSAQTIEDMQNVVRDLDLGLRLMVNDAGTGVNLVSEISGIELSVGETGGTTATDLGLRTLDTSTKLADFRNGLGVEAVAGKDDMRFTLSNGTTFDVNLDGATNVGETIGLIEQAANNAGLAVGTDFVVDFVAVGNGLTFEDNTGGAGDFSVMNLNDSHAAAHLGIEQSVAAGAMIDSGDQARVRVEGVFTHLMDLRAALESNDERGITLASERLQEDVDKLTYVRASVGVEARSVEQEQARSEDRVLTEKTMLSNLQDADLSEVITRFSQLQQQWQAGLMVGAQNMQMSLLDFLR